MARPTIDAAQSAAAMIANIDRVIRETEQQEKARTRGAPAPADGAAPPPEPAPPMQAPGGYGAPAPAAPPPPQSEATATGALGGYAPPPAPAPAAAAAPAAPPTPRPKPLEDLDVFLSRLRQFKDWLQQDPRLLAVVDDYIGQRVQRMEARQSRQNVRLAIITTVAGAILGWVTSLAGTPTVLLRLFGH